jgi:LacI family transcriptional regulator
VATATGVSINTVSAVLNERSTQARIGEKTRKEIQEMARHLGYRRNTAASLLAGGRSKTLGILLDSLANNFGAPLSEAFEKEAAERGYQCFLGCTQFDNLRKLDYVERFLEHSVEGLLLIGVWLDPDVDAALNTALSANTPVVTVDIPWTDHDVPLVCGNHFMGGKILAEHLLNNGHRKILYLSPPNTLHLTSIRERIHGFHAAIEGFRQARGDLKYTPTLEILDTPDKSLASITRILRPILKRTASSPSVIAAGHDLHAFRVITALKEMGYQVPEDIAVVGYDDIQYELLWTLGEETSQVIPIPIPITTIRQPMREIGREAARVLISQIETGERASGLKVLIDVSLTVRGSCRLPDRLRK